MFPALFSRCLFVIVLFLTFAAQQSLQAQCCGADPTIFRQPDGTEIEIHFHGNEKYTRTTSADGYTLFFDHAKGAYYYAKLSPSGDDYLSTGKLAKQKKPDDVGVERHLEINAAARKKFIEKRTAELEAVRKDGEKWQEQKRMVDEVRAFKKKVQDREKNKKTNEDTNTQDGVSNGADNDGGSTGDSGEIAFAPPVNPPTLGDVLGLTILVDFSDVPARPEITRADFDDYCNKPGGRAGWGNKGSVYDYFYAQSNGRLRYNNNVTYYVRVPHPYSYYNDTSAAQNSGTNGRRLLIDALNQLIAEGYDFSGLTANAQGRIIATNLFWAGNDSGVWASGLWPHRWSLSSPLSVGGGLYVFDYQCTDIGSSGNPTIGTFCHENGHLVGKYPDYYDTDSANGNSRGVGNHCLMGGGNHATQTNPTNISGYLKYHSGWVDAIELKSLTPPIRLAASVDGSVIYKYTNSETGWTNEYFLIENRSKIGGWESTSGLPDSGLMISHIHQSANNNRNQQMTEALHYEFSIEQADGLYNLERNGNGGDANDYFHSGGTGPKTEFNDTTSPSAKWWKGSDGIPGFGGTDSGTASGLKIHSVSAAGSVMTFVYGEGTPSAAATTSLSTSILENAIDYGGTAPSQSFFVYNSGADTVNYTITDNVAWLSVSSASGSVSTATNTITVNYNTSSLAAGTHTGTITVDGGTAGTKTITVTMTVRNQPTLSAVSSMSVSGFSGLVSSGQSFNLKNTGGGTASYTITKTQPWLTITPTSGTVNSEFDAITLTCSGVGLVAGTYNDTITITAPSATNSPLTIPVTFTVVGTDMIVSTPNGGEKWTRGTTQNISWVSTIGGDVKIELMKNGILNATISANTPNDGSFDWSIPSGQALDSTYRVRITSIQSPDKLDTSNADFTIAPPPIYHASMDTNPAWTMQGAWAWGKPTATGGNPGAGYNGDNVIGYNLAGQYGNSMAETFATTSAINCTGYSGVELSFYRWLGVEAGNYDKAYIRVSNNGTTWTDVYAHNTSAQGTFQETSWSLQTYDISAVADNQSTVYIRWVMGVTDSSVTYSGWNIDEVKLTGTLTATPSGYVITQSGGSTDVVEGGATDTYTLALASQPAANVTVAITTDSQVNVSPTSVTFTTSNWASPQNVTVTAVNDVVREQATHTGMITHTASSSDSSYNNIVEAFLANISDNDNNVPVVSAGSDQTIFLTGSSWTPANLTPGLWLDAADTATITLNGNSVAQWDDKSSFARHATATGTSQPANTAAGLNGKGVVTFDGVNDFFAVDLDFLAGVSHSTFIVTKPTVFSNIYGAATAAAGANSLHVGFSGANYRMNFWANDFGPVRTTNFVSDSANLMNYVWTAGTGKQILANGKSEGTNTNAGTIGTMSGGGRIGHTTTGSHTAFGGDIAEFIAVTGTISLDSRQKMEGYLAHKWGLAGYLDGAHPYKSGSPNSAEGIASLDGTVSDADLDPMTITWSLVSGPGAVVFGNPSSIDTNATFTAAGTYTLRLTANDNYAQAYDDVVVTVNPAPSGFTVTYNGNGNTSGTPPVDATNYTANASVTVLGNTGTLTRTGYTFSGWNTAANGSGTGYAPNSTFNINSQVVLYAQWTANSYTLTFNANGGSSPVPSTKSVAFGSTYGALATTTRSGYSFNGWFTATSGGSQVTTSTVVSTASNHTLYAQWTANTYNVSYDGNGNTGGSAPVTQTKTHGTSLTLSDAGDLVRAGYVFSGWNSSANGSGTAYAAGATYSANAAITLYAQWTITATLAVDISATSISEDGGSSSVTVTRNIPAVSNLTVNLSTTPAGKVSIPASVTILAGETSASFVLAAANDGLTGTNTVTVSASASGHTGGSDTVSVTDIAASRLKITLNPTSISENGGTATATLTRAGSNGGLTVNLTSSNTSKATVPASVSFSGNNATTTFTVTAVDNAFSDGNQLVTIMAAGGSLASGASVLTVTDNEGTGYAVTYNANGATSGELPSNQTKFQDINLTLASNAGNLARTGYAFAGWNTSADGTGTNYATNATYTTNAPLTLYAKWTANSYTVTFDANGGGTPSTSNKSVTFGSTYGTLATINRTGYTFNGWFTESVDGTEVTTSTAVTNAANHTLYARWTANSYVVTFNSNGGDAPDLPSKSVTYDSTYGELATASRTGYTLNGWFTAASGGTQVTSSTTVNITADQTLYAQWTANTYTVTFDSNGGDAPSPTTKQVTFGGTYGTLATVNRTGYTFNGWFTAASGGTQINTATTVGITNNQTLFAQWTANTYTVTFDPNGGGSPSQTTKQITFGSTYGTLPTTSRTGYNFDGWFTQTVDGAQVTDATPVATANNHTLYAQWSIAPVLVVTSADSVNVSEGSTATFSVKLSAQPIADVTVTVSTSSGDADITVQSGGSLTFTTANWDSLQTVTLAAANDGDAENGQTIISCEPSHPSYTGKNVTASEIDKHATLVVTTDGNGSTNPVGEAVVEKNEMTAISATPDDGYDFAKWLVTGGSATLGDENVAATTVIISSSATIQATFSIKKYAISYNGNGHTGGSAPGTQEKTHGLEFIIAGNTGNLVRTDYSFAGWNTSADGTGTDYPAGSSYVDNAPLTLYAKWIPGANGTWVQTGAGPFDWTTAANWSGSIVASGTDRTAFFTSNITSNQVVNIDAPRTIGNITFTDSTSSSNNLTISGLNALTMSRTSGMPVIDVTQSGRTLTISSQIAGNNGLQKSGAGNLTLSGENTFSGGFSYTGGTLTTTEDNNLGASGLLSFTGSSVWSMGANAVSYGRAVEYAEGSDTRHTSGNAAKTISGVVSGSGSVLLDHTTSFIWSNPANTFTGDITARTGNNILSYGFTVASLPDASGVGRMILGNSSGGGSFRWTGTGGDKTFEHRQFVLGGTTNGGVIQNLSGNGDKLIIKRDLGVTGTGNKPLILAGTAMGVFSGNIADSTSPAAVISLTKTEGNTWALGGTNTYSGITDLAASGTTGRLIFQGKQSLSPNTTIAFNQNSSNVQSVSFLDDGNNTISFERPITFAGSNTTQAMNIFVGNNHTDNGGSNPSSTTTGSIIKVGNITWNNAGQAGNTTRTLNLTGANGYSLETGNFILPSLSNRTAGGTWTNVFNPTTARLVIGGNITMTSGNSVDGGIPILQLGGSALGNRVLGTINDADDAATTNRPLSLTKTGTSDWTLSGNNTYTGTTTVSAGKLIINGNQSSATGAVSVAANATLGGKGTIGGDTTIANSGRLEFDLSTSAANHDRLELISGKSLTFSGASTLTITSSGGASPGVYVLVTAPGGISGNAPATVNLPLNWEATVSKVGNDLVLNVTSTGGPGPVDSFVISGIPGQGSVGNAINNITITAKDATDQTATSFTGTVTISGTAGITGTSANFVDGVLSGVTMTPLIIGNDLSIVVSDGNGHSGQAIISVISRYSAWITESIFEHEFIDTGSTSNPDNDGLTNLQEFAFGTDPTSSAVRSLSYQPGAEVTEAGIPIMENTGTAEEPVYRAVFIRRRNHEAMGLNYSVEFSADLKAWTAHTDAPTPLTDTESTSSLEAVALPFPTAVNLDGGGTAPPKFFRVGVAEN